MCMCAYVHTCVHPHMRPGRVNVLSGVHRMSKRAFECVPLPAHLPSCHFTFYECFCCPLPWKNTKEQSKPGGVTKLPELS